MTKRIGRLAAVVALMACATAQAIPPPWLLEKDKAAADLILIAKTTTATIVKDAAPGKYVEMKIGLESIEVLKGKLPGKDGDKPRLALLYRQLRPAEGPLVPMIGGAGEPKPTNGETALIFLKQRPPEASFFSAACGSFGYVSLEVKTKNDLDKLTKRIGWFRDRLSDKTVRKAMNGYYDKALLVAGKRLAAHTAKPIPWRLVVGKSPTYIKAKARELVLRGTLIVKNVGKPGCLYTRPPLEYYVKTTTRTVLLGPPMDEIFRPLDGKTVEVKGKMQPWRPGAKKNFLRVGWIREITPPAPPSKQAPETRPVPESS